MSHTWMEGDAAYLVPNRPTAPRQAYHTPRCLIITLPRPGTASYGRVEIELPDGHRLWTSLANLQRTPWQPPRPTPPPTPARRIVLADNEQQPALFGGEPA